MRLHLLLPLLLVTSSAARADEPLWLVRQGQAVATIVYGHDNQFAAQRLGQVIRQRSGASLELATADTWQPAASGDRAKQAVVLIGSRESNPVLRRLAGELSLDLDPKTLTDQGYVARRVVHEGREWLILAGGGRAGAQYAVVDLFQWELQYAERGVWLDTLDTRQVPRFTYRWFWNWDNRMEWGGAGEGGKTMAEGAQVYPYTKAPEAFLVDGKRCIDFMADHKFNALALWGFLRDEHGGMPASQELCRYAAERGVRILPGVGTSGYGGYYYTGQHEFNSDTWLAQHPELQAVDKEGKRYKVPCPSNPANQDWLDRGAAWLFKNFQIGGVALEMGDFFVCYCDGCKQARAAIDSSEADYYKDMAISHRATLTTMRRLAPDAWLNYATYTPFTKAMMDNPPKFLALIPEDAICTWTLTQLVRKWDPAARPMARHNLGYLHWCNVSSKTPDNFYLEEVQRVCQQAAAAGLEGLDTYGELPDERPNVELCYLAWEAFLWNPEWTLDTLVQRRLARLYGGEKPAQELLKIIPLVRTAEERQRAENLAEARRIARAAREASAPEGRGRWDRLIAYLDRQESKK